MKEKAFLVKFLHITYEEKHGLGIFTILSEFSVHDVHKIIA